MVPSSNLYEWWGGGVKRERVEGRVRKCGGGVEVGEEDGGWRCGRGWTEEGGEWAEVWRG